MAYNLNKIARLYDVDEVRKKLDARTNILTYNNAGAHNSIYRGKNLGTAISSAHISAIQNGSFADLYPGDYFKLAIDGTTTAYVVGCNANPRIATNHLLLWLVNPNWKFTVNDTNTCAGALLNSKMYTVHLPYILGKIREVIPDANILPWLERISDSLDAEGNVNHWTHFDTTDANPVKIGVPSFCNLVGYDVTNNHGYQCAGGNPDWPAFRLNPSLRIQAGYIWLDSNHNATMWHFLNWPLSQIWGYPAAQKMGDDVNYMRIYPYIHIG